MRPQGALTTEAVAIEHDLVRTSMHQDKHELRTALDKGSGRGRDLLMCLGVIAPGGSGPRSFLRKTRARELLRVDFADENGWEDACAWLVPSPDWWTEALHSLQAGDAPPTVPPLRA